MERLVLIVDDNAKRVDGLATALRVDGIVAEAYQTAEAFLANVSLVPDQRTCLVVSHNLPGMTGLELQQYLRQHGITIPVVFIAEDALASTFVQAARAGAVGFFEGSFDDSALLTRVQEVLDVGYFW